MKIARLLVILYVILSAIYRNNVSKYEIIGVLAVLVVIETLNSRANENSLNLTLLGASGFLLATFSGVVLFEDHLGEWVALPIGFVFLPSLVVYAVAALIKTFTRRKR